MLATPSASAAAGPTIPSGARTVKRSSSPAGSSAARSDATSSALVTTQASQPPDRLDAQRVDRLRHEVDRCAHRHDDDRDAAGARRSLEQRADPVPGAQEPARARPEDPVGLGQRVLVPAQLALEHLDPSEGFAEAGLVPDELVA